jgi:large subunit ribosomal protein L4
VRALNAKDIGFSNSEPISAQALSTCVRALLLGWRQGTVAAKGRSDVSLSNKKPWKQKGTGRARAGTPRSPLWRGGGVIFGPQERTRVLKINKKIRRGVLSTVLANYLDAGKVLQADWSLHNQEAPKTALAYNFLKSHALTTSKIILFVKPDDFLTYSSFANIPNVSLLYFDQPNVFDLVNSERWVILNKDMDHFKEMVSKWN